MLNGVVGAVIVVLKQGSVIDIKNVVDTNCVGKRETVPVTVTV